MGRFITIRGIKLRVFGKISEAPAEPVLPVSRAFFDGGLEKKGVFAWCFCGEFVVDCVINVVRKMAVLRGQKTCHFLQIYFQGLFGERPAIAVGVAMMFSSPGCLCCLRVFMCAGMRVCMPVG
jgi:hypothetical protein